MDRRNWTFLIAALLIIAVTVIVALGMIQATSLRSPFRRVVLKVAPAVVNIAADKLVRVGGTPNELDNFLQRFPQPKATVQHRHVLGSGFIFDPRGYILTNYHVISGYEEIVIRLADGTEFSGDSVKKVGVDPWSDLAVLKINTKRKLPVVKLGNSDHLDVGDWVAAVGNPFGLQGTLTAGVISAFNRSGIPMSQGPQYQDFIQTDASINPGNSGGPLVNDAGEVIGVNSGLRSPIQGSVGIGFAIPVNFSRQVADILIQNGAIVRGYLGLDTQPIDDLIQQALSLGDQSGALVSTVYPGGPASLAGIRAGDVIVTYDNQPVSDVQQFQVLSAGTEPGRVVDLELRRWGRLTSAKVKVAPRVEREAAMPVPAESRFWLGLSVRDLAPTTAQRLPGGGVVVDLVESGSKAEDAGIKTGDIIVQINDSTVNNAAGYQNLSKLMALARKPLLFRILRGRQAIFVGVEPTIESLSG